MSYSSRNLILFTRIKHKSYVEISNDNDIKKKKKKKSEIERDDII